MADRSSSAASCVLPAKCSSLTSRTVASTSLERMEGDHATRHGDSMTGASPDSSMGVAASEFAVEKKTSSA